MQKFGKYTKSDRMFDLVSDNYRILLVMSRFGISLGFDKKTIEEVCTLNNVDTTTFLTVTNMLLTDEPPADLRNSVSMQTLLSYLQNSHAYFLKFRLPRIRQKLIQIVGANELSRAITGYFDEYTTGVEEHMTYEEQIVFPYVRALLAGSKPAGYSIEVFRRQHDRVEALLTEFKNILIKYYPSESTNELNSLMFDIFECEQDLASHNAVEDLLFVPAVRILEQSVRPEQKSTAARPAEQKPKEK